MDRGTTPSTASSLLERIRQREESAWSMLVEVYGPLVYRWIRRNGLPAEEAADVVQETFVAVSRGIEDFSRERSGAFRAWLWTIARNRVNDHFRRLPPGTAVGGTSLHELLANLPAAPPEDESASARQRWALVQRALRDLEADFAPHTWAVFQQSAIAGRGTAEVADELGMSPNGVRQARSRVLRRLREYLADFDL